MTTKNRSAARALFTLIDGEGQADRLRLFHDITLLLMDSADGASKAVFTELQLWSGLLLDTPAMGREYRAGVVAAFPWITSLKQSSHGGGR